MPAPAGLLRVDRAIAQAERGLIVVLLAVMTLAVFLDALHRVFAAGEGRSQRLLSWLLPAGLAGAASWLAPLALAVITFVIACAALRARRDPQQQAAGGDEAGGAVVGGVVRGPSRRVRGVFVPAAIITAAAAGFTQVLVWLVPSGLVFSQQMSLCFLLWIALCGASLGARDRAHIAFELAGQMWPVRLRRPAERVARVVAALFTLFLALLAARHAHGHYVEWATSGGAAGSFEAFAVPRFVIFGFLPLPLATLALRFLLFGVRADDPAAGQVTS